jgi:hypothetical protein
MIGVMFNKYGGRIISARVFQTDPGREAAGEMIP